ncbi:MAG: ABC transporter ATP-binding protein/permease [Lachnospiraceae bacterium]|nr:ABC transporter ATP-binding protein/permease [Lachnospiraceae bacterium]
MAKRSKALKESELEQALSSEKSESNIKITKKTLSFMLSFAWKEKKSLYLLYLIRFIGNVLGQLKILLLPKLLVDELMAVIAGESAEQHLKTIIFYVAVTVTAELVSTLLINIADSTRNVYSQIFNARFSEILSAKSMGMDYAYTEDPKVLDKQNEAKEGISWYSGGLVSILDCLYYVVYNLLLMVLSVTVIAVYCPLLLPVQIILMFAVCYFNYRNQLINTEFFLKLAKGNRIFGYVLYELAEFRYGKDIRMYDSGDMMCNKGEKLGKMQVALWGEQARLQLKNGYGSDMANALRDGISYLYMGLRVLWGKITVGEFTLSVSAASNLYQSLIGVGSNLQQIGEKCNYASRFLEFLDYPDTAVKGNRPVSGSEHVIEFKDVSFKYPRAGDFTLRHVNITIRPNEHLSVVGLNGAGKTTFIKLLCRMYDVTEGAILVDGVDIREYSEEEYRRLFSVVFQDFAIFAFSLRENIEMGDVDFAPDDPDKRTVRLNETLELSGLKEDAEELPNGVDTILYKSFDEKGTELSGGQRQKTAISRALYRNAPIVILDEPTAALDPVAEYDIYRKFDTLVGHKSAIYISHRLSSCKFCDRIAVFSEGTVKEYGTHDELVGIPGGIYAEMFHAQARYYAG